LIFATQLPGINVFIYKVLYSPHGSAAFGRAAQGVNFDVVQLFLLSYFISLVVSDNIRTAQDAQRQVSRHFQEDTTAVSSFSL
jgi:hypothetical protein